MKRLLIVRPEPGASATAGRARALGVEPLVRPLFTVEPVAWAAPDPARFDALLLTSASAVRCAGQELASLARLPVLAVGNATARAARGAGLTVDQVGDDDLASLLRDTPCRRRLLHLAGEHHRAVESSHSVERVIVYRAASVVDPGLPEVEEMIVAVHSPRAGARLAELVTDRGRTDIVAISAAAAAACGAGWRSLCWPPAPGDPALLELAARLCQSPGA